MQFIVKWVNYLIMYNDDAGGNSLLGVVSSYYDIYLYNEWPHAWLILTNVAV